MALHSNVHISALNGALWYIEQLHSGSCELGQLTSYTTLSQEFWFSNTTGCEMFDNLQTEIRFAES